nr:hypothetical protein [Tanacetum cinerariifolium]
MDSLPDHPLVNYGLHTLERMKRAGRKNINNMIFDRNKLLQSMAEKQEFINNPTSPINLFGCKNTVIIIPGPAGILQAVKLRKTEDIKENGHGCVMPTHEYVRKIIEDASKDDQFTCDSWLSAVEYLNVEGSLANDCFVNMKTFCVNGKLKHVVAVIKTCTSNALGELTITLKYPFGTISDTIYHKVLTERGYGKSITFGVV